MSRARPATPWLLLGAAGVAIVAFYVALMVDSLWVDSGSAELRDEFTTALATVPDGGTLTAGDATTSVEWDCMFIFRPYTPVEQIDQTLGFRWEAARETDIEGLEGINLVVLTAEGDVVGYFSIGSDPADFDVPTGSGYTPDATFTLDRTTFTLDGEPYIPTLTFTGTSGQTCK